MYPASASSGTRVLVMKSSNLPEGNSHASWNDTAHRPVRTISWYLCATGDSGNNSRSQKPLAVAASLACATTRWAAVQLADACSACDSLVDRSEEIVAYPTYEGRRSSTNDRRVTTGRLPKCKQLPAIPLDSAVREHDTEQNVLD
jgi:hypothetical protein